MVFHENGGEEGGRTYRPENVWAFKTVPPSLFCALLIRDRILDWDAGGEWLYMTAEIHALPITRCIWWSSLYSVSPEFSTPAGNRQDQLLLFHWFYTRSSALYCSLGEDTEVYLTFLLWHHYPRLMLPPASDLITWSNCPWIWLCVSCNQYHFPNTNLLA